MFASRSREKTHEGQCEPPFNPELPSVDYPELVSRGDARGKVWQSRVQVALWRRVFTFSATLRFPHH